MSKPTVANQATGEIVVVRGSKAMIPPIPKRKEMTELRTVAGDNPLAINLKDHPELNGKEICFTGVLWRESMINGKTSLYVLAHTHIYNPGEEPSAENYQRIMTGSENVIQRLADAELASGEGSPYPLFAKLRTSKGGRAWFLD